jgi:NADPH2:quinone reductase
MHNRHSGAFTTGSVAISWLSRSKWRRTSRRVKHAILLWDMPTIPASMIAIEITAPGGPDVLRAVTRPVPRPGRDEVLIEVAAAGVNRPDVMQRLGKYPPPPGASDIPGLEVAGRVAAVEGDSRGRWHVGDQVCALVSGGGYAEYCVAPAAQCLPLPAGIDPVTAAAIPETTFTVWTNLFERGRLQRGERVLLHGGTSGIGTTAIQLAHASGATVFATAGSDAKCEACRQLGADVAINYRTQDFVEVVGEATGGAGVDAILDMVGGDYVGRNLRCLATDGRLVQIGLMGGARGEVDFGLVLRRRLTITGSTLRVRSVAEKAAIARDLEIHVWPWLADRTVVPQIDRTFPLSGAADAHRRMESGEHIGKIVLTVAR